MKIMVSRLLQPVVDSKIMNSHLCSGAMAMHLSNKDFDDNGIPMGQDEFRVSSCGSNLAKR
jgi:hypothetical protein